MDIRDISKRLAPRFFGGLLVLILIGGTLARAESPQQTPSRDLAAASEYKGRIVQAVKVIGNTQVSSSVILQLVRTHEGDKFDPDTVVHDYQRIYDKMKTFANVEARVQPTDNGVIVLFVVTEQKQIHEIRYVGNVECSNHDLEEVVDLKQGEAIEPFRLSLAQQAIEKCYQDKNFSLAHVSWDQAELKKSGDVVFHIVEGPRVRIRKIDFIGNNSFSAWRLKQEIKTAMYIFIFSPGKYDPELLDEDVSAIRKFYQNKGFFDARVGRKLSRSPDMKAMQVTFLIDEGPRYYVDSLTFDGNKAVSDPEMRKEMKIKEGIAYDKEAVDNDIRSIVKLYSKRGGYIYDEQGTSADYLHIDPKPYFEKEKGKIRLVYEISEGKLFRQGRILVKGNEKTQDKVILREMRMRPGQSYNSTEVENAQDRLRGLPEFTTVQITPVGNDPDSRDLLVNVTEQRTAQISAGLGVNSNGGFGGQLAYEQRNFDIANPPASMGELFSDRAFTGVGQDFQASFQPGTQETNATVSFTEPYLFDQPYSFGSSLYYQTRIREVYNDDRFGGSISFGKRFDYIYSASIRLRGEDVDIKNLQQPESDRAPEIVSGLGHHTLTGVGLYLERDTTNHGPVTFEGSDTTFGVEDVGAMGGTVDYDRLDASFSVFEKLGEDLLGRKTVLNERIDFGQDVRKAPFYERFYGGGFGSIRGFEFRGVTPRSGPANDQIGGDFSMTGTVELGFPVVEDFLRGVVFLDGGDVEPNFRFGTIRASAGFGIRLTLPFFGKAPLALDFGFPITQSQTDQKQVLSFSFGISR